MKFGFAVPAYGKAVDGGIAELIDAGEELGFDSAWWPDHIAVPDYAAAVNLQTPFLEPLAACAWGTRAHHAPARRHRRAGRAVPSSAARSRR